MDISESERCHCCRGPGAAHRRTVREADGLLATWVVCARCRPWLALGFAAVHPDDRLDARTTPMSRYHLTPADIQRYIREGAWLGRRPG